MPSAADGNMDDGGSSVSDQSGAVAAGVISVQYTNGLARGSQSQEHRSCRGVVAAYVGLMPDMSTDTTQ